MRIAFITLEYPPFIIGGAGVYASRLVEELCKAGNEIVVFMPRISGGAMMERSENLTVCRIPLRDRLPLKSLQFSLALPRAFGIENDRHPFDVVHFNSICYWFLKRRLSSAPQVVTVHHTLRDARASSKAGIFTRVFRLSDENNVFQELLDRRTVGCADLLISVSQYTGKRLADLYGVPQGKITVVRDGLNFEPPEMPDAWPADREKNILFVGRVDDPRKGLDLLLEAFRLVAIEHDASLVVAGAGDPGETKRKAGRLGIAEKVRLTGYVDEETLKRLYLACDVYAVPSRLEGFGLTVLEAMAAGKPVVATRAGAIPELMEDSVHGALVEPGNVQGMARAICTYLEDEGLARRVGTNNKTYVSERFSWASTAAETIEAYRLIMDGWHGQHDTVEHGQ